MRVIRHQDFAGQFLLEKGAHAGIFGYAAGEDKIAVRCHTADHPGGPANDAGMQSPGDLPGTLSFGNQGGDLGFGKDRAHAGDIQIPFGQQCLPAEGLDIETQRPGHDLHELPGPGGATVIHLEFFHPAVFKERNGLAVLAADIQHGPGLREKGPCPPGMGLDLGYGRGLKGDLEQAPAVTGCHDPVIGDPADQSAGLGHRIEAGIGMQTADDIAPVIDHNQFDGAGTDIDPGKTLAHLRSSGLAKLLDKGLDPGFQLAHILHAVIGLV